MNTELFQGVKPCSTCSNYEYTDYKHKCKKSNQLTQTARLIHVECHTEKKGEVRWVL